MAQDSIRRAHRLAPSTAPTSNPGGASGEGFPPPAETVVLPAGGAAITLRPEQPTDLPFLTALFRASARRELAHMPVDAAVKEALVRMQVAARNGTYRGQFPAARFDIIERRGQAIGRIVVDPGGDAACIVDMALLPEHCGRGLGSAILASVLTWFADPKRRVVCTVLASNAASLRMCHRVGFKPTGLGPPFVPLEW